MSCQMGDSRTVKLFCKMLCSDFACNDAEEELRDWSASSAWEDQ